MGRAPGGELWLAQIEEILARYRARLRGDIGGISLEEAVSEMRKLGITEGEARRWLKPRAGSLAPG